MKKTKFKHTEVGMIPHDWNFVEISELAKDMADGPFGSNLKKEHYTSDPQVRIIQLSNIGECGWENENTKYTTFEHAKTIARCIVPKEESILVAKMMPAGRAIICPETEKQYVLGSDVIRITANEKLNPKYFVYATKSQAYLKQISDNTQGSTRQRTSISKLRKIAMPLPSSIEEQRRIADALSDVDTLIANLEKLIAKKKNIKQGAMQQLLTGRKRLPGFAPTKPTHKQTEFGPIPTDWEFVPVSELAKDMADGPFGSNLKKEHYTSDPQARIIQLSNVGENGWEDENTKYTTFEHAKTIARCIVPKEESILVAKMMPAGRAIICPKKEKQYVLGSDVIRITANEKLNSKYFVYASKSDAYLKQISDNTQGSTRQRTSISKLRKILILLPSLAEQTAIANVLSDMDAEIDALEQKLAKVRKIKQGMMQELLTGKIRLV